MKDPYVMCAGLLALGGVLKYAIDNKHRTLYLCAIMVCVTVCAAAIMLAYRR